MKILWAELKIEPATTTTTAAASIHINLRQVSDPLKPNFN
jgi:hypothetical protein